MDNMPATMHDIATLYEDFSACLLAIASGLETKGLLSNAELRTAAQERLLSLRPNGAGQHEFAILRRMATAFPSFPERS